MACWRLSRSSEVKVEVYLFQIGCQFRTSVGARKSMRGTEVAIFAAIRIAWKR